MRLALALTLASVAAALAATGAAAQATPRYYCDAWGTYYPWVRTCPVPWRLVNQVPAQPPAPAAPATKQSTATASVQAAPSSSFPMLGDNLDAWCAKVKLPSSIAICSDPELRSLMLERQKAFDAATSRLAPNQQKALLADQNGWVKTYAQACGLSRDVPPSLPLASGIKDCVATAGRARIAYLRAYGQDESGVSTPSPPALQLPSPPVAEKPAPSSATPANRNLEPAVSTPAPAAALPNNATWYIAQVGSDTCVRMEDLNYDFTRAYYGSGDAHWTTPEDEIGYLRRQGASAEPIGQFTPQRMDRAYHVHLPNGDETDLTYFNNKLYCKDVMSLIER